MNRLTLHRGMILAVPSRYLGSIDYYAAIAAAEDSVVMVDARYDKRQKQVHRADIADVNGLLRLTVPTAKPESATAARWSDIRVSDHGAWPAVHRTALESSYGRTPFFEFYAPDILPLMVADNQPVVQLNASLDAVIRRILMLPPPLDASDTTATKIYDPSLPEFQFVPQPYYQVRADRLGFLPHLSILDLIFNMGPESPLILRKMIKSAPQHCAKPTIR